MGDKNNDFFTSEFADLYLKLNKSKLVSLSFCFTFVAKTKYMPKILHLKKEFLYYYNYIPNDWARTIYLLKK